MVILQQWKQKCIPVPTGRYRKHRQKGYQIFGKNIGLYLSSLLGSERSGKFPSSFCRQLNKKVLVNCLGRVVTFYIAIKNKFP